jgi:multicomponent Na+:H+ antiporter subunit B
MRRTVLATVLVLALGGLLAAGLAGVAVGGAPADRVLRHYIVAHGAEDTGSINLVSSIYLGYRAFDTLGETVVLFLAVTGVITLRGGRK